MPVLTVSYPAKDRNFTAEVGDRPETIVVVGSTNTAVFLLALVSIVVATAIRLRSCLQSNLDGRFRGGLVKMTSRRIEKDRDGLVFLIPLESIGEHLGDGRSLLVLRDDGVSSRVRSSSRKNKPLALLRRQPTKNIPGTIGPGWPAPPVSIPKISAARAIIYPDRRVVGSRSSRRVGEGTHRCEWIGTRRKG